MPTSGMETTFQEDSSPVHCSVEVFRVCRNRFSEIYSNISLTLRVVPLILPPHRGIYCLNKENIGSDISELFIVILHPVNMKR